MEICKNNTPQNNFWTSISWIITQFDFHEAGKVSDQPTGQSANNRATAMPRLGFFATGPALSSAVAVPQSAVSGVQGDGTESSLRLRLSWWGTHRFGALITGAGVALHIG